MIGKNVEIVCDEKRIRTKKSEVNRLLADAKKAKKLLGWEPEFSLDDGLQKTIDWISEHLDKYKVDSYNI